MTAAMVTRIGDNTNIEKYKGILNDTLVAQWLKFADVSEKSVKTYNKAIHRFFVYLNENSITLPTADDVYNWRDSLRAENKSASTVNLYLTSCKLFFKFLAQRNIYQNIAEHVKGCKLTNEHKREALTAQQGKNVLKSFDTSTLAGLRDKAMTALMMTCGLRTIEVSRANIGDMVKSYGRTALYVQGKGRTDRRECVMIPAQVEVIINEYLEARGQVADNAPLFAGIGNRNKGGRLTTDTISRIVKKAFKANGMNSRRLTAHSLRHSAATAMLLAGMELTQVQQVLRHKNINTTLVYSHHLDRLKNHAEDAAASTFLA